MGDFDGDGHQDANDFGYNKRQIRLIVVNYGEGRELYSPKPGTGYHAVNWISWSGQPTTKPLTEYLASTTRKEALKQFGTENCDVEDVRKNREVLFTKYSETYTNAYAVNENMPIAFCKSNHKP